MKILITGANGFIGHHMVEHFLKNTDWKIQGLDRLSYASTGFDRVRDINVFDDRRYFQWTSDITRPIGNGIIRESNPDYILHLAAETHVDNSITNPRRFIYSNVVGTLNMLEFARQCPNLKAFVYFSTDEVFGPAPIGIKYKEWDRYNSTNPYSASKAGAEELCLAYMNTYRLQGFITHCMNVFGERQHAEKFVPLCIRKILNNEMVYIHGSPDGKTSGSRFYIHARNVANAVHFLLDKFEQRGKYNIVGEKELTNLELAWKIAGIMGKDLHYKIVDFHSSRPGHDLRYALDGSLLEKMGWTPPMTIDASLASVVKWTLENRRWLNDDRFE